MTEKYFAALPLKDEGYTRGSSLTPDIDGRCEEPQSIVVVERNLKLITKCNALKVDSSIKDMME